STSPSTTTTVSAPARTDAVPAAPIAGQSKQEPAPAAVPLSARAQRLADVQKEYDDAMEAYFKAMDAAKTDEEYKELSKTVKMPDNAPYRARARALVDEDPKDDVALDAI